MIFAVLLYYLLLLRMGFFRFPLEDFLGCDSREAQDNGRVAEDRIGPVKVGRFLKVRKIVGAHLHVDLDSTLSAGFHPHYRYVGTLLRQRY